MIDHILCFDVNKIIHSGVIQVGLSDHFIIFCTRKAPKYTFSTHNTINIRSLKNYNPDTFAHLLDDCDWSSVLTSTCADTAWSNFQSLLINIIDKIAPRKTVRMKQRTEPWMTATLLDKIRSRDKMIRLIKNGDQNVSFTDFATLRNSIQRDIKKAKTEFFKNKLDENMREPKKLWHYLGKLGYSSKTSSKSKIVLDIDGVLHSDTHDVTNHINNFFTTVADKLTNKLPQVSNDYGIRSDSFERFYTSKGVSQTDFELKKVSADFVFDELSALNVNKSSGLDDIAPRFLKDGAFQLAPIITHIINLSIESSIVPHDLKLAKVIPLFKKKSRLEIGNYRPVSLLNSVSKILEKCIYIQLESYLSSHNLIYNYQSGFRHGYSTDTCLIYLTDFIRSQIDKGHYVGMLLLDVQKAFDSVNHEILCYKLECMGIKSDWFKSYLSDRKQLVSIDDIHSDLKPLSCGVPQGSLLGPLLYLCYSNDMVTSVKNKLLLYADDSVIISSHINPDVISDELSSDLRTCNNWLINNKLSLHVGKTELILFGSRRKLKKASNFSITYKDHVIKPVSNLKYLGVQLDQHLSGEVMAEETLKKATSRLKFLYRHSNFFNQKLRKSLCSALLQCHIDYCCNSWHTGLSKKFQHSFQILQNKMIRYILKLSPRDHVGYSEIDTVGFLCTSSRSRQLRLNHMFNIFHSNCPDYLNQFFVRTSDSHSHRTRASSWNFFIPRVGSFTKNSFFYQAALDWNDLPSHIKAIQDKVSFKKAVKKHLSSIAMTVGSAALV